MIERGEINPTLSTLYSITTALNLKLHEFLNFNKISPPTHAVRHLHYRTTEKKDLNPLASRFGITNREQQLIS